MSERNTNPPHSLQQTQQQRDNLLMEVVQQVGTLTKRVEAIWAQVFDKLEGPDTNNQEDRLEAREPKIFFEGDPMNPTPMSLPPFTPIQNSQWMLYMHTRERVPPYCADTMVARPENFETNMDKGAQRVQVDVLDFHGKLDPYAFQDWITSLEDYFEWFKMPADCKVRFVKMKLKGQTQVWLQSVEEQLYRTRQPSIAN